MDGYYRIKTPLSYGGEILHSNTVHYLRLKPENISKLIELGHISQISTPPIEEIPELQQFAERLNKLGIYTLKQFLEAKPDSLKSIWRRKDYIETHKQNLIQQYLLVEKQKDNDCGCS